ncbi:EF-hand calcium-binding domain-containing protein 10-like [Strongylocentrotus purpuratus]|uniref:EF-hand domain-containing protein n=1 Tax=Strongylocentrotus purpuratus TaxID=7668 RepID=A0A7M7NUC3_STRPU|nr:EF-hand calcium-binding domain-containing protein 10-like [Strongylocentrotus purpuratus]|eukprot:XP_011668499.1 PREDICTED: EF-hand calcium-binding domain-containing protein 10 [Strongylocentrotus purpuratus]
MTTPRETETNEYLDTHRIPELFHNITSQLVFHRPENPKTFMIDYISKLKEGRTTQMNYPCLFDDTNIDSVFGMLDPTKKGHITLEQYREAMQTMGCQNFDEKPTGVDRGRVTADIFAREVKAGLKKASGTFEPLI